MKSWFYQLSGIEMHLLIGLLLIICLFLSEATAQHTTETGMANMIAVAVLTFLVPALALLQTIFVSKVWKLELRDHECRESMTRRMTICHAAIWIATSLMITGWTGWQKFVQQNLGLENVPVVDDLIVIAPMLVALLLSWAVFYDLQHDVSADADAAPEEPQPRGFDIITTTVKQIFQAGRLRFVAIRTRVYLALALLPVLTFVILRDFSDPSRFSSTVSCCVFVAVAGAGVLGFPWLVCWIWNIKPIADAALRGQLEEFCDKHSLTVGDIRIWNTGNQIVNAMVIGMIPRFRMIVISDAMLNRFTPAELEAILRHEAGHIRLLHLPFRLVIVLLPLVVFASFEAAGIPLSGWISETGAGSGLHVVAAQAIPLIVYGIYLIVSMSWLSRKMEFEADRFAATSATDGDGFQSVLDSLLRLARLNPAGFERRSLFHPSLRSRMEHISSLRAKTIDSDCCE